MNRYLIAAGYYIIAARWHSGQNSHGYAKGCQATRLGLKLADGAWQRGSEERQAAAAILWKRRREVRRFW